MSFAPGIDIDRLAVRYGETTIVHGVSFSVARGELVTLLGPSGCGKTTILRAIAGLEQPCAGTIRLGGTSVYDGATGRTVPAESRGVSMVFQSYAIWPHMSVAENVAYGLHVRRLPKQKIAAAVDHALGLVQMRGFAGRPATQLSGGQQQRVAVARAIAFDPDVLLFDEPLSNLDAKLRAEMRVELRELQQRLSITSLYVTHDQEEALAISDRVIVLHDGRIEQEGTPEAVYNHPLNRFVADFVGSANLIRGSLCHILGHRARFEMESGSILDLHCARPPGGAETTLALRSAYLALSSPIPEPAANTFSGRIHRKMFHGDFIEYVVLCDAGRLVVRRPPTEQFEEGAEISVRFDREHAVLI